MSTTEAVVAGVAAWIILPGVCFIGAAIVYDWWFDLHQLDARMGRGRAGLWEFELDQPVVLDLTDVEAEEFLDTLDDIRGLATR